MNIYSFIIFSKSNKIPSVLQIEFHPYLIQPELMTYCKKNKIQITAYSPLGHPGLFILLKNL